MNFKALEPGGQIRSAGKLILIAIVVIVCVAGAVTVIRFLGDPLGFSKRKAETAQASATVNGQQAASNAAGAQINDHRASNVARIHRTAQEARHALWQEDDLDAAVGGYLADLDRLRDQGRAPVGDAGADQRGPAGDPGSAEAIDPDPAAGYQP